MDVLSTALSGIRAAEKRLEVSANNVANANTEGFEAKVATPRTLGDGGVIVDISTKDPATITAPALDGEGTVELPNVSLDQEAAAQVQTVADAKANARVIKTQRALDDALLDIEA